MWRSPPVSDSTARFARFPRFAGGASDGRSGPEGSPIVTGPRKVLVVEQNPGEAGRIRELLDEAGHADWSLPTVERVDAGLAWLERTVVDAVILDLTLRDLPGFAALTTITSAHPDVPVVVLADLDDEAAAARAIREGAQDYLVRGGLDADRLARSIRHALERKKADRALRAYVRRLETLREVDRAILRTDSLEAIARSALELLRPLMPCRRMSVTLGARGPTREALVLAVVGGSSTRIGAGARLPGDVMDIDWLWQGEPRVLRKTLELDDASPAMQRLHQEGVRYIVNIPLLVAEEVVGSLNLGFHDPGEATEQAVELAQDVADHLAIAIRQADLRERARDRRDGDSLPAAEIRLE